MAKKKKKDDEDDIEFAPDEEHQAAPRAKADEDEDAELDLDADEEAEIDLEAAEEEEAAEEDEEAEIEAEDEDEEADLEEAGEDEEAEEDEEEEKEEKEEEKADLPPRPRTPILTMILLFLNFIVAPIFVLALYMDYAARNQWSYATLGNRVLAWGLPLEDDAKGPGLSLASRPRMRLDSDKLKAARGKAFEFEPVDTIDEPIESVILPSQIDANIQQDLFAKNRLDEPVTTLEDEVRRLQAKVPGWIDAAAAKVAASADNNLKKETAIKNILLPLASTTKQVEELQARLDDAKAKGPAELDKLLAEAAKRRMLADILLPWDVYRPGDVNERIMENICEQKLDVLDALLIMRIVQTIRPDNVPSVHLGESLNKPGSQRDDVEKRHNVAFLLVTLSQIKVPELKEMLMPKGFERAQAVCGSFEFAIAAANYARTLPILEGRILAAIEADHEGYLVKRDQEIDDELKPYRNPVVGGFAAAHADTIRLMKQTAAELDATKTRNEELVKEAKRLQNLYEARAKLLTEVNMQLLAARKTSAEERELLRAKEQELFEALRDLSDAADRNVRLERRIVEAEDLLLPKKGKTK